MNRQALSRNGLDKVLSTEPKHSFSCQYSMLLKKYLRRQIGYCGNKNQRYVVRDSLLAFTVQTIRKSNL